MEPANRARQIAEGISCVMNVLAPLAWPERFGALSAEHGAHAAQHIGKLRAALGGDLSNIQADVKMGTLRALLPEIEAALAEPCDPEKHAQVAREFFAALNIDPQAFGEPQ